MLQSSSNSAQSANVNVPFRSFLQGLCEGDVREMAWGDVNGWVGLGGAKLGSKRALPTGKMDKIAENLKKFRLQASLSDSSGCLKHLLRDTFF